MIEVFKWKQMDFYNRGDGRISRQPNPSGTSYIKSLSALQYYVIKLEPEFVVASALYSVNVLPR